MEDNLQGHKCSGSVNLLCFEQILVPAYSGRNFVNRNEVGDLISDPQGFAFPSSNLHRANLASEDGSVCDAVLKHISQVLMEDDDLENEPTVLKDRLALQAAEKSFYDVLDLNHYLPQIYKNVERRYDFTRTCCSESIKSPASVTNKIDFSLIGDWNESGSSIFQSSIAEYNSDYVIESTLKTTDSSSTSSNAFDGTLETLLGSFQMFNPAGESQAVSRFRVGEGKVNCWILPKENWNCDLVVKERTAKAPNEEEKHGIEHSLTRSRGKKNHFREDGDSLEASQSNKQLASYAEDADEQSEKYDKVLLSPALNPPLDKESSACQSDEVLLQNGVGGKHQKRGQSKGSGGGRPRSKKQGNRGEVVDLMTLLTQCAQAVSTESRSSATELLKKIRLHSSPHGNGTERMAHYVANALEVRMDGNGRALHASPLTNKLSSADTLTAYLAFLTATPFRKMAHFFANKLIWKLVEKETSVHIIDFGIKHGFQWPHLMQHLSRRPGGPPRLRITGIDFPQPGFRPAERAEETGHRLGYYCTKFNVPFEYVGVAKKWDTIRLEDLKVQRGEVLVVNCLFQLRYVLDHDETVGVSSPRDAVLNLIKSIDPDIFIHGVVNGTYNAPFFVTRFREVLNHSYTVFDMFDAVLPREDQGRMIDEKEVLGKDAMSVIGCEGIERIVRPETYKQWQIRNTRAGLRQLPLDQEIVEYVRAKVKSGFHKEFVVDEDSNWMLQGWKGRILCALSCWKPVLEIKN